MCCERAVLSGDIRSSLGLTSVSSPNIQDIRRLDESCILSDFRNLKGRIGVLGGSFDPIHLGHISAAEKMKEALNLSAVVFIPAHQNPFKPNAPWASDLDRLAMIAKALDKKKGLFVSGMELSLTGEKQKTPSYTIDTLKQIRKELPNDAELFLLIGADLVENLDRWHKIAEFPEYAHVVPYARAGHEFKLPKKGLPFSLDPFIEINSRQISSTDVRNKLKAGCSVCDIMPEEVLRYIEIVGVYYGI